MIRSKSFMESGSSKGMMLTLNVYILLKPNHLAHQVIALLNIRQEVLGEGKHLVAMANLMH